MYTSRRNTIVVAAALTLAGVATPTLASSTGLPLSDRAAATAVTSAVEPSGENGAVTTDAEEQAALDAAARDIPAIHTFTSPNPALRERLAQPGQELLAAGILRTPAGLLAPGVDLRADLEPAGETQSQARDGVAAELIPVGRATTGRAGEFQFSTALPGDLSGYIDHDGLVSVLLSANSPAANLSYHLRLAPPQQAGQGWAWSGTVDSRVAATGAAAVDLAKRLGLDVVPAELAGVAAGPVLLDMTAQSGSDLPVAVPAEQTTDGLYGGNYCAGSFYWSLSTANTIVNATPVQRYYTMARTVVSYEWTDTVQTQIDAAANTGTNGALVNAGYTSIQERGLGTSQAAGHNGNGDFYWNTRHHPYYLYCNDPGGARYSGRYEWRSAKLHGGFGRQAPKYTIFSCNSAYRTVISGAVWAARSASYTYGAGADVGAVSLRVQQTNTSAHKHTIQAYDYTTAAICGDRGTYTDSGTRQIREVPI